MLRLLLEELLIPDVAKELREELTEIGEKAVVKAAQEQYRNLLMTGPFDCEVFGESNGRRRGTEDDILPDRPRCTVMSVILQQIDTSNSIVTVAIVDKYGELVAHQDFQHLMPPRKMNLTNLEQDPNATEEEQQRLKKLKMTQKEENREHEGDRKRISDLIITHRVELIVVGANRLEARLIKKVLSDIAEQIKNYGGGNEDEDRTRGKKRTRDGSPDNGGEMKEAFVIWGSLEVPKLFANCHHSSRLVKNAHPILKQAVSLARFEQDPLVEVLNLWSFVPSENQTLGLTLHPLQKLINQAKLSEALEEINIQVVNAIGVDLNRVLEHDHMHVLLSFVSGLGPRRARKFIQTLTQFGKKIQTRGDIFKNKFLDRVYHFSAIGFLKIKVGEGQGGSGEGKVLYDILDQTRVHPESYMLAHKVANDIINDGQEVDQFNSYQAVKQVIQNPKKLNELDIQSYKAELEKSDQTNMFILLNYIMDELQNPFKDPRRYRTPS